MDKYSDKLLCPSAPCEPGALLIGRVKSDRSIAFALSPLKVTESFVKEAARGQKAEERFRFANSCVEEGCQQWKDGNCQVAKRAIGLLEGHLINEENLRCTIRANCRWFSQSGYKACRVCRFVTTER